jgi:phenylpropionate dioxygenase-like ring-hydroxylating dioxygenase large terminal subunit
MTSISLPPSLIQTLPGRLYTDPAVFEQEQARIFESMWFAVARSAELGEPGQFVTKQVGTESVIVVRGRDGALRAFLNVCRHRWRPALPGRVRARSGGTSSACTTPGPTAGRRADRRART